MKFIKKTLKKIIPVFIKKQYWDYASKVKFARANMPQCPICKAKFKSYKPYEGGVDKECPVCISHVRHRLLWLYLKSRTSLFTSEQKVSLLHFAPERSFYSHFSQAKNLQYTPCDLSPEYYNFGKAQIVKVDITDIPFPDNHFDVILCNHVLEHIPDDKKAMSELYRVLKPGGWAILQVPIDYSREFTFEDPSIKDTRRRRLAFGQWDHVRSYGRDYPSRLASAGFNVTVDDYVRTFSPEDIFRMGLRYSELIYFCSKP